jgi:hypothetical protein
LQSYLIRLKVLEGKVPPFPELVTIVTEILASVLVLLGIFTKYIRANRMVKTFRSLVSGEDVELRTAQERFHKLVAREEGVVRNAMFVSVTEVKANVQSAQSEGQKGVAELRLGITQLKAEVRSAQSEGRAGVSELKLDLETAHMGVTSILTGISDDAQAILTNTGNSLVAAERMDGNIQSVLTELEQARDDRKDEKARQISQEASREREEILTWLSPLNHHNKQHATLEKYHSGTVQWLISSGPFQKWLHGDQNSTIWCPGDGRTLSLTQPARVPWVS